MSKKFLEKQNAGVMVRAAEWVPEAGKPDTPENWTRLKVRMDDGSRYTLKRTFVNEHGLDWGFESHE